MVHFQQQEKERWKEIRRKRREGRTLRLIIPTYSFPYYMRGNIRARGRTTINARRERAHSSTSPGIAALFSLVARIGQVEYLRRQSHNCLHKIV